MSPGFSKVRGGSCGFGTTQGGTSGPAEYIAAEDVFNTKWEAMATGIELGVNEQQSVFNNGESFIDDKAPIAASVRELGSWYNESAMSVALMGGQVNGTKTVAHFAERDENGHVAYAADVGSIRLRVMEGDSMREYELMMQEADHSLRCLGEWANPTLLWHDQVAEVKGIAVDITAVLARRKPYEVTKYVWEAIFVPKVCRPKLSNAPATATQTTYLQSSPPGDPATA